MIVVRSPLSINFLNEATEGWQRSIVAAIDKFVYVVVNRTPLIDKVSVKYSVSESVEQPIELKHTRVKAALLDLGISKGVEIGSFATLPARTGLGSSSSFCVALSKGLHAFLGKRIDKDYNGYYVSKIEQGLLGENYYYESIFSSSYGGLNAIQLNKDKSVVIKPLLVSYKTRRDFEDHVLLFFTGSGMEYAGNLNGEKRGRLNNRGNVKKGITDEFVNRLMKRDFRGVGTILMNSDSVEIGNPIVEKLYAAGMNSGSWGGKILEPNGACLLFILPPDKREIVKTELMKTAGKLGIDGYKIIPIRFVQSGAEILFNGDHYHRHFV